MTKNTGFGPTYYFSRMGVFVPLKALLAKVWITLAAFRE